MNTHEHAQEILSAMITGLVASGDLPTKEIAAEYAKRAFMVAEAFRNEAIDRKAAPI